MISETDDLKMVCVECEAHDAPIFLCAAGWWCESCYRKWSGVPEDVSSEDLHDGINDGRQSDYIEALKQRVFGFDED